MSRVQRVLMATAMATVLATTSAAWMPGGAEAATGAETDTMAQGGSCTYNKLDKPAMRSHKGKGDTKYNNGETKRYGRVLILSVGTALSPDNSAALLSGKVRKGDRAWVDISHDKGKNWKNCGHVTADKAGKKVYSKWFAHYRKGSITNRVIRACATTTMGATDQGKRVTWCADIGDVKTTGIKSYWWTDKD
ncbi:hypothetical protein [Streptomyces sp. NPDC088400]|uniref:hypothetical protein n=1 Tax=Streptomyces sp. NPDC088400 TaxID=3365861 RepID=UPI003826E5CB